jgi:hypothetical protein
MTDGERDEIVEALDALRDDAVTLRATVGVALKRLATDGTVRSDKRTADDLDYAIGVVVAADALAERVFETVKRLHEKYKGAV